MYVNPFWFGVLATIVAIMGVFLIAVFIHAGKGEK